MRVDRGRHALSDQVAALAQRARLGCSFFPSEARSALCQTLPHGARGKRAATFRIDIRIVEQAKGDRVDSRGVCKLIQSTLQRKMTQCLVWRPQCRRSVAIYMNDLVIGRDSARCSPKRAGTERSIFD